MLNSKNIRNWIIQNKIPLIHFFVWVAIFLLPYIYASHERSEGEKYTEIEDKFVYLGTILKFFWVIMFYLNTQVLIHKFIYQKKYISFIFIQCLIFGIILFIDRYLFIWLSIDHPFHIESAIKHNISAFFFTLLASVAFKLIWDKSQAEQLDSERQKETLKTELSFLRSQISPHFLFNVLNNIVAMVRLKSDDLEDTVVKLSTLLQYMLYETDEEKVLLRNEIDYLESYIELQSQRFGNKIDIIKNIEVKDDYQTIEPMLLIPFVENAFKHGYGLIKNPVIDISLKVENEHLFFEVKNKCNEVDFQKDKTSGIGLANVKRRLELLYHNDYQLLIEQKEGWFQVKLALKLKNSPTG